MDIALLRPSRVFWRLSLRSEFPRTLSTNTTGYSSWLGLSVVCPGVNLKKEITQRVGQTGKWRMLYPAFEVEWPLGPPLLWFSSQSWSVVRGGNLVAPGKASQISSLDMRRALGEVSHWCIMLMSIPGPGRSFRLLFRDPGSLLRWCAGNDDSRISCPADSSFISFTLKELPVMPV